MEPNFGKEECLCRKTIYDGRIVRLRVDEVRLPNGRQTVREVVEHAPAVGILAEDESGNILLVRQYRYPVAEHLLEVPAGIVEKGEAPAETARRELQEEVGFDAERVEELCRIYTSPGFSDEVLILFRALGLHPSRRTPDDDENIEVVRIRPEEIPRLLAGGAIKDGKTIAALCLRMAQEE